jgi:hypothetical protein
VDARVLQKQKQKQEEKQRREQQGRIAQGKSRREGTLKADGMCVSTGAGK